MVALAACAQLTVESDKNSNSSKLFKINTKIENKGRYVTSVGELLTLIVYVFFSDDAITKSDAWKFSKTKLPGWTQKMINQSTKLDFSEDNVTQYFYS